MILPVAKLGTLALKTLCKPIAKRIKKEAGFHPQFRLVITNLAQACQIASFFVIQHLCAVWTHKSVRGIRRGHNHQIVANHRLTTKLQRRIYGHATDVAIRPLNEEKAVQAAADLLGELFVFTVAGAAVIMEVQRSSRAEARKEALRRQEIEVHTTFFSLVPVCFLHTLLSSKCVLDI
ncbi:OLC1v1023843C4 [Oldenlandia corymbosa var. corymbosa]|uniref:OLC1v1023843C4 n=1 Tax=Oldenlandia corymbosa var. corymbosa TaxID=529605 RepID=A0AAV1C0U5_OLDCO|nr:OLC1v1023843C4 [Oldenlandia corymbosa var. corymbosa]